MEIVKEKTAKTGKTKDPMADQKKALEKLVKEFDKASKDLAKKEYMVSIEKESIDYLLNDFLANIDWKGYECYGVLEIDRELRTKFNEKDKTQKILLKKEYVEATFHFLKNHIGKGLVAALKHKKVSDAFAEPMSRINQDNSDLRQLATDLHQLEQAVEQGVPLETKNSGGPVGPQ